MIALQSLGFFTKSPCEVPGTTLSSAFTDIIACLDKQAG